MRPIHLLLFVCVVFLPITAPTIAKQLNTMFNQVFDQQETQAPEPRAEVPSARDTVQPHEPRTEARFDRLGPEAFSLQQLVVDSTQPAPGETGAGEALSSRSQPPGGEVSLAPPHSESPPTDGLPVAGMRCFFGDGGAMTCGACRSDGDCPAGMGCVANRETRRFECLAPECEEDAHCFPDLVCRAVTTGAAGPVIRRCVSSGERREGEPCDGLFISQAGACQEGLLCHRSICSRPCRLEEAHSCPEGYTCEDGLNGPACFSDCRSSGCPSGHQCKQLNESEYQCLSEVKGDCPEKACGAGERCNLRLSRGSGVFWCAALCNPLRADSCPSEQVCGMGSPTISTCYRRCDPRIPDACGEGLQCTTVTEDLTQWGCSPVASP